VFYPLGQDPLCVKFMAPSIGFIGKKDAIIALTVYDALIVRFYRKKGFS
jgi:hypothetical protein